MLKNRWMPSHVGIGGKVNLNAKHSTSRRTKPLIGCSSYNKFQSQVESKFLYVTTYDYNV